MVPERVIDGTRLAELLSSELHGRDDGALGRVAVTDAVEDVEPAPDGALAFRVEVDGVLLATVHVHSERAHVAFRRGQEAALAAAGEEGLRARPKATHPPETLVFVESGAQVKRAARVVAAAAQRE